MWMWADPELSGLHGVEPTLAPYLLAHRGQSCTSRHMRCPSTPGPKRSAAEMEVLMRSATLPRFWWCRIFVRLRAPRVRLGGLWVSTIAHHGFDHLAPPMLDLLDFGGAWDVTGSELF